MAIIGNTQSSLEKSAAFHYGLCAFEGILCWKPSGDSQTYLFRLESHLERLKRSMEYLGLKVDGKRLKSAVMAGVSSLQSCVYVRPIVYSTSPFTDIRLKEHKLVIKVFSHRLNKRRFISRMSKGRQAVVLGEPRLAWGKSLADVKVSGKYCVYLSARESAKKMKMDEALLMDRSGRIAEASIANLLLVRGNILVMPQSLERFPGITLDSLIVIAEDKEIHVVHEDVTAAHLSKFDDAFICGTASGVVPLSSITYGKKVYNFRCSTVQDTLRNAYVDVLEGNKVRYQNWLTPV